jgi:hypothetical protein
MPEDVTGRDIGDWAGTAFTSNSLSRVIMAEKEQAWETRVARKTRKRASNSR